MGFAEEIRAWAEQTEADAETILRATGIAILRRVVLRSPVGNPELWAANAHVEVARASYNVDVERTNTILADNPLLVQQLKLKSGGKLKKPKQLSARAIAKRFPLAVGKGYVGGRFRGNWQVSYSAPKGGTLKRIDPSGNAAIGAGLSVLAAAKLGETIFIVNNLPYAIPLEYGHSKQAPNGMVRLTATEFLGIVDIAVRAHA